MSGAPDGAAATGSVGSDTLETLRAMIVEDHAIAPERLTPEATLDDLGIDSLGTIELLWRVEERFGIEVPSEPAPLATLGDVARYVDALVAAREGDASAAPTAPASAPAADDPPA